MGRGIGSYIRKGDEVKTFAHGVCVYCDGASGVFKYSVDHIKAIHIGGDSSLKNLTLACRRCNSLKQAFTIKEFFERVMIKRDLAYRKAYKYLGRIRNHKKRHSYTDENFEWLQRKVRHELKLHTYFTSIIFSIQNTNYIIHI